MKNELTKESVDYNSWIESDKARKLAASLDKDTILVEGRFPIMIIPCNRSELTPCQGYKEFDTGRTYMARMGDWRNNKDEEIELDGVGGVNIIVKADVHRSGMRSLSGI